MRKILGHYRVKAFFEMLSIVGPVLCLIDCIVIPIAMIALPFASGGLILHGVSDQLLALLMLCFCAPSIVPGYLKHRRKRVLYLSAGGFFLVFMATYMGHATDEVMHIILSGVGSMFVIKANLDNKKFANGCSCKHTASGPIP